MSAEVVEEVGGDRDGQRREDLAPRAVELGLERGRRRDEVDRCGARLRRGQALAVDLARDQRRQRVEDLVQRRAHVRRQPLPQRLGERARVDARPAARHDIGDERVLPVDRDQRADGLGDGGVVADRRLDLGELDAVAADLDLGVDPPGEHDVAVPVDGDEVARAVDPFGADLGVERRGDELGRGLFGQADVADADAGTAEDELAGIARRQRG